ESSQHVRALIDTSDGLADALAQIAHASEVGMDIDQNAIPVAKETLGLAALAGTNPLDWALYGGEDYELVACVAPDDWERIKKSSDCKFRKIGIVIEGHEVSLRDGKGNQRPIDLSKTFQHFRC